MADAELHIIVKQAGDPEKLGALLNAAMNMKTQERPVRMVIPMGYRCCECWRDDGGHEPMCSMRTAELVQEANGGQGSTEQTGENSEPTPIRQGN